MFTNPGLVIPRPSILGPPAEGRPGPSFGKMLECKRFDKYHVWPHIQSDIKHSMLANFQYLSSKKIMLI